MATVVNEFSIEPKAAPPEPPASGGETAPPKGGPQLEREVEKLARRERDRALRLWAH